MSSTDNSNELFNQCREYIQERRHSTDIFGDQQIHDTSVLYSVPLTNPSIYSKNNAISISKKYDLPTIFKELMNDKGTVRMDISLQAKHMLLTTNSKAAILLQYRDIDSQELAKTELTLPIPSQQTQPPFIRLTLPSSISGSTLSTLERNAHAGLVLVTMNGKLYHWPHVTVATASSSNLTLAYKEYRIPLGNKEEIRCVTTADLPGSEYQVAIGTSIGNVYLVKITDDSNGQTTISHTSLYQTTIPSTVLGSIWSYYTSSGNDNADIGGIIKIKKGHYSDELVVMSSFYIQRWTLSPTKQPKLISRTQLQDAIHDHAIPLLLQKNQATNARIQLLDIDKYGLFGWVVLISYTIPEMGEFVQFALVCMEQVQLQPNNDKPFKFINTYSLPYSVKPSTLKRRPSVHLSNGSIAFVSFDNTVVSIAVDSRFEHALVLQNDTNNEIIGTIVKERYEEDGGTQYATGLIFTTETGVLEYKVDQQYISKSQAEGNIFANDYEDESIRDMALTRSKLEQAIFFGCNDENPLYFPIQLDRQQNLGCMVASLAKDIVNGDLELMPKTLDTQIILDERIKFIQRIPEILKKEGLLELVDSNYWTDVWAILESCNIGLEVKKFLNENRANNVELITWMEHCFNATAQAVMDQNDIDSTMTQLTMDDLISTKVLLLPKCLEHLITHALEDEKLGSVSRYQLVNSIGRLIYNIVSHVQSLERLFAHNYLGMTQSESLFFGTSDIPIILHKNFTKVKTCVESIPDRTNAFDVEMADLLVDYSSLLLDIYRKNSQLDSSVTMQYQEERDFIINTLWKLDIKDTALNLAKEHHYYPLLVTNAQDQTQTECQILTEQYVHDYGDEFVRCLISFYSDNDDEERLLHFDPTYDHLVSDVLAGNPKIGWKYHLQKGRYKNVYESLHRLLPSVQEIDERKVLLSQAKLACLASNEKDVNVMPLAIILESSFMKSFSNDLELTEAQEQTTMVFKDMVIGQNTVELNEQVDMVITKAFSRLVETECINKLEVVTDLVRQLIGKFVIGCDDYILLLSSMDNNGPDIENYLAALYFAGLYANNNNQDKTLLNLNRIWKAIYTRDDWEHIDQCVKSRQHLELSRLLAQTTAYRVLLMCKNKNVADELILRPASIKLDQDDNQDKLLERYIRSHRLEETYFDECILNIFR